MHRIAAERWARTLAQEYHGAPAHIILTQLQRWRINDEAAFYTAFSLDKDLLDTALITRFGPALWWREYMGGLPALQRVAAILFNIPPTAAAGERNWSVWKVGLFCQTGSQAPGGICKQC